VGTGTFEATPLQLTISNDGDQILFGGGGTTLPESINWGPNDIRGHAETHYDAWISAQSTVFNSAWDTSTPVATLAPSPEPSTAALAVVGAIAFLAYGWSRQRRAQRQQAAA
jgi:hypothetical protein